MVPKGIHILIPGICDYVTFCGKRDFAHAIKNSLNREIILHYLGGSNLLISVAISYMQGGQSQSSSDEGV